MLSTQNTQEFEVLESVRTAFDEAVREARVHPELALHSAKARVRTARGIACDVEHPDRTLRVDLPRSEGGGATGPHPGQLLRASVGACLVMGYRLWAARLGVPLRDVSLDIACEFDARGQLGVDPETPVGWKRLTIDVVLMSEASEEEVLRVVETTHRLSPMLSNLSKDIERVFNVTIENDSFRATSRQDE